MVHNVLLGLLIFVFLPVQVGAQTDEPLATYVATNERCRLVAHVAHEDPLDPASPLRIDVWTTTRSLDPATLLAPVCGTADAHSICFEAAGSYEEGFVCAYEHGPRIAIGGTREAPETAPGVHRVPFLYQNVQLVASATSAPRAP